jgi:hypothetical protein
MRPSVRPYVALICETTLLRIYIRAGTDALQGRMSLQLKIYLSVL